MNNCAGTPNLRSEVSRVEIAGIARLVEECGNDHLAQYFSTQEIEQAGIGEGRAAKLAEVRAARQAIYKLFAREPDSGEIVPADFGIIRTDNGLYRATCNSRARKMLNWHRIRKISITITRDDAEVSALATAYPLRMQVPLLGRVVYRLLPIRRRVVLENLHRVFAGKVQEEEILRIAQACYAHLARLLGEFVRFSFLSQARRQSQVRVENGELALNAADRGQGLLVLAFHLGNWELAPVGALKRFPQYRDKLHVVRRPLNPRFLDYFVTKLTRLGISAVTKSGALGAIKKLLAAGHVVIFAFDQHASPKEGVLVNFLGHPAWTHRSLVVIAKASGAPIVPVVSYREPGGNHVLRFGNEIPLIEKENWQETIRFNTRIYNEFLEQALLEHPEQWIWLHRRWKETD